MIVARRLAAVRLSLWDVFLPVHGAWWAVFGVPLLALLHWLVGFLAMFPITLAIGPFGLAVMAMTLLVRLVLLPLAAYQVRAAIEARREAAALQARLGPRIEALRKRHRRQPDRLKRELDELLRTSGASPAATIGRTLRRAVLPNLIQAPLLIALYVVIGGFAHGAHALHFLWIANLAVPDPLLLPLLAGLSSYLIARLALAAQPRPLVQDEQAAASQRLNALLSPLALAVVGHFMPAALVLYWLTGNLVLAAQQWAQNRIVLAAAPAT
jgi:YidC/Oxa1 family membrane protein insertase